MRRLSDGETLTFSIEHEAWHWGANRSVGGKPTIYVQAETDGGGVTWQFAVVERADARVGDRRPIRVEVFDEAFAAFRDIPEFFAALDRMPAMTLADVATILRDAGVVDITPREIPPHLAPASRRYRVR